MDVSTSSEGDVSLPLLEKYTLMPPASMRPPKSVVAQVRETLFSFLRKTKDSSPKSENGSSSSSEKSHSLSQKQRSEEAFLDRVATFTVPNWLGKPLALSPPLLAHYGWQCIGLDTVKCCSCSAIFSVRLPWPNADNYREQCLSYRQKVLTTHTKICSWPSYPCSDSFVSPFLHGGISSSELREEFVARKKNLIRLGEKLPQLERKILKELNLSETQLQAIVNIQHEEADVVNVGSPGENDEYYTRLSLHETAAVLSMCGWDTKSNVGSASPTIFCKTSGRSVGLWNFYSFTEDKPAAQVQPDDVNSPAKPLVSSGSKRSSDLDQSQQTTPKKARILSESSAGSPSHMMITKQFFHPLEQHHPSSSWITVLKPISADEFEDGVSGTNEEPDAKYKYVVTPALPDKKAGWVVVRDTLLKKKYEAEDDDADGNIVSGPPEDGATGCSNASDVEKLVTKKTIFKDPKSPPKAAVLQVRKMTKEWSSPK